MMEFFNDLMSAVGLGFVIYAYIWVATKAYYRAKPPQNNNVFLNFEEPKPSKNYQARGKK